VCVCVCVSLVKKPRTPHTVCVCVCESPISGHLQEPLHSLQLTRTTPEINIFWLWAFCSCSRIREESLYIPSSRSWPCKLNIFFYFMRVSRPFNCPSSLKRDPRAERSEPPTPEGPSHSQLGWIGGFSSHRLPRMSLLSSSINAYS